MSVNMLLEINIFPCYDIQVCYMSTSVNLSYFSSIKQKKSLVALSEKLANWVHMTQRVQFHMPDLDVESFQNELAVSRN